MPLKMHATVVQQFGKPLEFLEWDIPSPGAGQILVKTEACGVCHTDLHAARGDWPVKPTLPFIPGHEAIGLVTALGSGVTMVKEGPGRGTLALFGVWSTRVLLDWLGNGLRSGAVRGLHQERRFCRIPSRRSKLCCPCTCGPYIPV